MWDTIEASRPWVVAALDQAGTFLMTRPSPSTSIAAVVLTPMAALVFFATRHWRRLGRFRFQRVARCVLPRHYLSHRSHVLDVLLMGGNIGLFALIVGQATMSMTGIAVLVSAGLTAMFGTADPAQYNPTAVSAVWSVAIFLSYEFAYWVDHYLSHNIPVLWEFHKVHHTAEVLSPLTNFRAHPIDSLVFVNIVALCNGFTGGLLYSVFGVGPVKLDLFSTTVMIGLAVSVFAQLQHTHIWIAFTGVWGRLILSPAHHQIHHSIDTRHHNKNLGNLIAIFDWAFGTLHVPTKRRQKLVFGLSRLAPPEHTISEGLAQPFLDAARHVVPRPAPGQSPSVSAT